MKQPTEKKEKFDSFIRGVDKRLSSTCYVDSRTSITRIPANSNCFSLISLQISSHRSSTVTLSYTEAVSESKNPYF